MGFRYFGDHFMTVQYMATPSEFDDIRPYQDDEVQLVLNRLLHDNEFLDTVARLKLPRFGRLAQRFARPLVRQALKREIRGVVDVNSFQMRVKDYLEKTIAKTTERLSISGLDNLTRDRAYCFISNHRDIAMDPAFVNWALFHAGFNTLRIAIGDNLLSKPFASDLMRLNKSFIVKRSAPSPREKLKTAKKLSAYILHSIRIDRANIWIAQREGRAKDGKDKTNPAILSMLMLAKAKDQPLSEYLEQLAIVPVSISYEFDPCDEAKARELTLLAQTGEYQKAPHEDVQSIARGISGYKGRIHLAFGKPLVGNSASVDDVVGALDDAIWRDYVLHATNCIAYEMLEGQSPDLPVGEDQQSFLSWSDNTLRRRFKERVDACEPAWREQLLRIYANPVYTKLRLAEP